MADAPDFARIMENAAAEFAKVIDDTIKTEWAVLWGPDSDQGTSDAERTEPCPDKAWAQNLIDKYPAWDGKIVQRAVIRMPWVDA